MHTFDITAIQRGCVHDGEGVRTTIFFMGCPFRCPWCCNPETTHSELDGFIDESKCLANIAIASNLCNNCIRKGGQRPLKECPFGVYQKTYKTYNTSELLKILNKDFPLFKESSGGVTLSGGDPISLLGNLHELISKLYEEKIGISIETTLYKNNLKNDIDTIQKIDEWIIDLKFQDEIFSIDYFNTIRENLKILKVENKKIRYRLVHIESLNLDTILGKLNELGIYELELIKCHNLAKSKYIKLGIPFKGYEPSVSSYNDFAEGLRNNGVRVKTLIV